MLFLGVALAVGAVPELTAVVTAVFPCVQAWRSGSHRAPSRGVETRGSASVLAPIDRTLTKNEITVRAFVTRAGA